MDIFIILLAILSFWGIKYSSTGHRDYIGRGSTDSIKGIFAIIILFSHMRGYVPIPTIGNYDMIYYSVLDFLGQLMVVMFLFYSGYGIMEALKRNIEKYTDTFLKRRLLRVWIMFAVAVTLYLILNQILGRHYDASTIVLSYIGWESIGNSNWFVFDILILYLFTYASLRISQRLGLNLKWISLLIFAMTFCLIVVFYISGKGAWWYDTVLAFPIGMFFSIYKVKIEENIKGWRWALSFVGLILIFIIFKYRYQLVFSYFDGNKLMYGISLLISFLTSSVFAALIVVMTMKIKVDNKILRWLGVNSFAIYILQHLAMILAAHFGWNDSAIIFATIVIPSTLLISAVFTAGVNKLNSRIIG